MIKKNKIVIYTAITGGYDSPRNDIKCFYDNSLFKDSRRDARKYKILSHMFVETDYSIWVDGNIFLLIDPKKLINSLGSNDIAVVRHPNRDCIYSEAETIIESKLDKIEVVKEQMNRYKSKGYKKNQGLAMTGIIIRKHTERIKRLNEKWWAEVCRGSKRDQLSFNYIFDQEITYLDWPGSYNNDWFQRPNHQSSFLMRIRNSYLYPMKKILSK